MAPLSTEDLMRNASDRPARDENQSRRAVFSGCLTASTLACLLTPLIVLQNRLHVRETDTFNPMAIGLSMYRAFPGLFSASCIRNTTLASRDHLTEITNEFCAAGFIAAADTALGGPSNMSRLAQFGLPVPRYPWHKGYSHYFLAASRALFGPRLLSNILGATGYIVIKPIIHQTTAKAAAVNESSHTASLLSSGVTSAAISILNNPLAIGIKLSLKHAELYEGRLRFSNVRHELRIFWTTHGTRALFCSGIGINVFMHTLAYFTVDQVSNLAWKLFPENVTPSQLPSHFSNEEENDSYDHAPKMEIF